MKTDLDATLDRVLDVSQVDNLAEEPNSFYAELNNCKFKPIALSLVPPFAESFVLKSCKIPTVQDLPDPKYQDLEYPELLQVCLEKEIELSEQQRSQIEEETRSQSQGANFYKHRAGRIGASQSKLASHTNPTLPSQSQLNQFVILN